MPSLFRRPTEVAPVVDPAEVAVERGDQVAALQRLLAEIRSECIEIVRRATVRDVSAGHLGAMLTEGLLSPDVEMRALEGGEW